MIKERETLTVYLQDYKYTCEVDVCIIISLVESLLTLYLVKKG